MLHKLIHT